MPTSRNRPELLGILAVVAVLAGCPKPLDFGPRGVITDPAEVIAALDARNDAVHAVQGEARANIDTPKGGGGVDLYVVAQKPARFRLEAMNFFGQPAGVLATDGQWFGYLDLQAGQFVDGPATAANVSRLLPIILPPEELTALLLGEVPLEIGFPRAAPPTPRIRVDDAARAYVLWWEGATATGERIWLDTRTLRPLAFAFDARGRGTMKPNPETGDVAYAYETFPAYRAEFDDFEGPKDRPKVVRLRTADGRFKVELKWRDRELDPDIDPAIFTLQPPDAPAPPEAPEAP